MVHMRTSTDVICRLMEESCTSTTRTDRLLQLRHSSNPDRPAAPPSRSTIWTWTPTAALARVASKTGDTDSLKMVDVTLRVVLAGATSRETSSISSICTLYDTLSWIDE